MGVSVVRQLPLVEPRMFLHIVGFVKIGVRPHLELLQADGLLYCSHVDYFRELEGQAGRADAYEGTSYSYPHDKVSVVVGAGAEQSVLNAETGLVGRVDLRVFPDSDVNVFCAYAVTNDRAEHHLDRIRGEFGNAALSIRRPQEFLNRVRSACQKEGIAAEAKMVDYVGQHSHSGELGVFRKFSQFAYQNEFRVAFSPGIRPAREIRIGSIADISELLDLS